MQADGSEAGKLLVTGPRLIELAWAKASPEAPRLWPYTVQYSEGLSQAMQLLVHCISLQGPVAVQALVGRVVALGVAHDGTRRWLGGVISRARVCGEAAGRPMLALHVESALSLLDRRTTCRVFQDLSVPDIVATVLDEHRKDNAVIGTALTHGCALTRTYPPRSYCVQFNESDKTFIERLLEEEGIGYRIDCVGPATACVQHLTLFDGALHPSRADERVLQCPHGVGPGEGQADKLTCWEPEHALVVSHTSLASHDYLTAQVLQGDDANALVRSADEQAATSTLTRYHAQRPYAAAGNRGMDHRARLRMQAEESAAVTWHGQMEAGMLTSGEGFTVSGEPLQVDATGRVTYVVARTELRARNALPSGWEPDALPSAPTPGTPSVLELPAGCREAVRLRCMAVEAGSDWRPPVGEHVRPTAGGLQTATVVGPAGETVYTDALGRIRVQFHWQRPDEHPSGSADGNERASTWIRVALPSAGDGFGHQFLPRIGQEVLVAFLHDDIDRPVVIGTLHNGRQQPALFSAQPGLPGNRTVSGIRTAEHQGQGFNELVLDDSPGQVGARLASTTAASALTLGALCEPRRDGIAPERGTGAELRTDAALALRAAQGVLLTSQARKLAEGGQLERTDLLQLLDDCRALFHGMGKTAAGQGAGAVDDSGVLRLQRDVGGWPLADDHREGAPVVAISAEAGVVSATPASQLHVAGANHDVVATDHVQSVSGGATRWLAGQGISVFAKEQGMRLVANAGPVVLHAQADQLRVLGQEGVQIGSSDGELLLHAPVIRLLAGDGSYLRLGGGIELGSEGAVTVHGSTHDWLGPASAQAPPCIFASDPAEQQLRFHHEGDPADLVAGLRYAIRVADGTQVDGVTGADGTSERMHRAAMHRTEADALRPLVDAAQEGPTATGDPETAPGMGDLP